MTATNLFALAIIVCVSPAQLSRLRGGYIPTQLGGCEAVFFPKIFSAQKISDYRGERLGYEDIIKRGIYESQLCTSGFFRPEASEKGSCKSSVCKEKSDCLGICSDRVRFSKIYFNGICASDVSLTDPAPNGYRSTVWDQGMIGPSLRTSRLFNSGTFRRLIHGNRVYRP